MAVKQKLVLSGWLPFVVTIRQKTVCLPSWLVLLVLVLKELV